MRIQLVIDGTPVTDVTLTDDQIDEALKNFGVPSYGLTILRAMPPATRATMIDLAIRRKLGLL